MRFIFTKLIVISLVLIVSCSTTNTQKKGNGVFFPAPPDEPKIQFLKVISKSSDITGHKSSFETYVVGDVSESQISKPFGIASSKDRLIIIDTKASSMISIDYKKGKFDVVSPQGNGQFRKPLNCFIDNDMVYINDIEARDIIILDKNNNFVLRFGSDILKKPSDVFVYKENIYVTDMDSNKVFVFNKLTHQLISSFPDATQESEEFLHSPTHISIKNNKIYVTDFGEFHIKSFDMNGKYIKSIGTYGQNIGQFSRPKGIALDQQNNLFVLDAAFENVQMFDPDGNLLLYFGGAYQGPGYLYLPIRITLDYENIDYYKEYVDVNYDIKYLIYVTNQFGPDKVTVYGFVEPK